MTENEIWKEKVTTDVDDLITVLKEVALEKSKDTEKKLREVLEHIDWRTFVVLTKLISEIAQEYKLVDKYK